MINEVNTSNGVVEQPNSELDGKTTTGIFKKNYTHQCASLLTQMHLPYVGVAHLNFTAYMVYFLYIFLFGFFEYE